MKVNNKYDFSEVQKLIVYKNIQMFTNIPMDSLEVFKHVI